MSRSRFFGEEVSGPDIRAEYDLEEHAIGSGNFAIVKRARNLSTGEMVAVKIIDKMNIDVSVESLKQEVSILKQVDHENIVGLTDIYEDDRKVYLIMELMTGGELFDRIVDKYPNGYTEQTAAQVIKKIVSALSYLHKKDIVHRDLKPENLLYVSPDNDADIKITDFGLAKLKRPDSLLKTACGTPNYVAPEIILGEKYDEKVDMWSVGIIMFILLCGYPPFYHKETPQLFQLIVAGDVKFASPYWDNVSASAKDLISRLLKVTPRDRYSAEQCLAHPWIKGTTARDELISGVVGELKKFNARRKLKMGVDAVLTAIRLFKAVGESRGGAGGSR